MVNLLFITSCNKFERIMSSLQPLLKVRIDVVSDFDIGLKDVFEKRPATVFIQDQIAGVTGESVARHIQMLLGVGAPSFVFMHEGGTKAKPIKGLFEYLVDLSQTDETVVKDILDILKSHLGPQWDKVYLSPKIEPQAVSDTSLFPNLADVLVEDSVNSKTSSDFLAISSPEVVAGYDEIEKSVNSAFDSFDVVSSPQDQLAEIMAVSGDKPVNVSVVPPFQSVQSLSSEQSEATLILPAKETRSDVPAKRGHELLQPIIRTNVSSTDVLASGLAGKRSTVAHTETVSDFSKSDDAIPVKESPADFVIVGERSTSQVAPEELLRVFENSIQPRNSGARRIVVLLSIVLISVLTVYWVFGDKFSQLHLFTKRTLQSVPPTTVSQPAVSSIEKKQEIIPEKTAVINTLPTFVPVQSLDKSFASQKPGWERYIDSAMDYRLYRIDGGIRAIQILGVNDKAIKETFLESALLELAGSAEYRVSSRKIKDGFTVEQAVVGPNNNDLLIYRKKNVIHAFVISMK